MLSAVLSFGSCREQKPPAGPGQENIPQAILDEFESLYPSATDIRWTRKDDEYAIASFRLSVAKTAEYASQNTAWFELNTGTWGMTETEIVFDRLPAEVKAAFNSGEYAQTPWKLDDYEIDILYRGEGAETLYVIEVEKTENGRKTEMKLYYTAAGTLTKVFGKEENYAGYFPQTVPETVGSWIQQHFPGATILETDYDRSGYEVEIYHDGLKHDVLFSVSSQWRCTETDYGRRYTELIPGNVLDALENEYSLPEWRIDEVKKYASAERTYYIFELEREHAVWDDEKKVYVGEDGTLGTIRPGSDESGSIPVPEEVSALIEQKYPGAVIIEKDYDDGYLEIEIRHGNIEKKSIFDSRNEWVGTEYTLHRFDDLPQTVQNALIEDSDFDSNGIESIEATETADGLTYEIEVESGHSEIKYYIDESGSIRHKEKETDD